MINFKKTSSINDIALSIKKDVDYAILYYNSNNSGWKKHMLECRTINSERFAL